MFVQVISSSCFVSTSQYHYAYMRDKLLSFGRVSSLSTVHIRSVQVLPQATLDIITQR